MKKYIREVEAAERTSLSKAWFQRARWAGNGPPFVKFGNTVLYELEKFDAWFEARERKSTSEYDTRTPANRIPAAIPAV